MREAADVADAVTDSDQRPESGGLLVLAPHPDDETLGCGALLAASFAAGAPTHVMLVPDGERSHRVSPTWAAERLARQRRREVVEAVRRLGGRPSDVSFLGYPDCGVPDSGPALRAAANRIVAALDRLGPDTLLATAESDPHCDHRAVARIACAVHRMMPDLRLLFYPIWSRVDAVDPTGEGRFSVRRFRLGSHARVKRDALQAHASQLGALITDDPDGFVLPASLIELFLAEDEIFLEPNDAFRNERGTRRPLRARPGSLAFPHQRL
jgi:LmbE family N-acetylglucosaminyl deacetylase